MQNHPKDSHPKDSQLIAEQQKGRQLICGARTLNLGLPQVMGILNVTPDSFSDGGRFFDSGVNLDRVLRAAELMLAAGASILDVGGESTRPGAEVVTVQQELDRVVPVVQALVSELDVIVSVDTSTAQVISASAAVGAGMINDVRALQRVDALATAARTGLPVCLMHMQGEPKNMQQNPSYADVVQEVGAFFDRRMQACVAAGIAPDNIVLDPGFGFGKTLSNNLSLFRALSEFSARAPVMVGVSRKSMVGQICGRDVDQRLAGSLACALLAAQSGASIVRVHDVAETVDVLKVWLALRDA